MAQGFTGQVPGGHHQHRRGARRAVDLVREEQVVHGCVRQQDAQLLQPGSDRRGHRGVCHARHEQDRPLRGGQHLGRLRGQRGDGAGHTQVRRHHREGLVRAVLAEPEGGDRLLVRRVAGQVVSAQALDGHDPAVPQGCDRRGQRGRPGQGRRPVTGAGEGQGRAAAVAGDRLGVVAAVRGVGVLPRAVLAHLEPGHGGGRAVVGQVEGDGQPRAAVGAGDERVAVAAVRGVPQLAQAVVADGGVGWHHRPRTRRRGRRGDGERALARGGEVRGGHGHDPRHRRRLRLQHAAELLDGGPGSFDLDHHTGRVVAARAAQAESGGLTRHVRPEAHPLHDAAHHQAAPDPGGGGPFLDHAVSPRRPRAWTAAGRRPGRSPRPRRTRARG